MSEEKVDRDETHLRCIRSVALLTALDWDQDVQRARNDEDGENEDDHDVRNDEGEDVQRVVANGDEGGVAEGEDDDEDGGGDVAEADRPVPGERPVAASWRGDGNVQVPAELVALDRC